MDVTYEENVRSIKDNIRGKSLRLSPTGVNEDTFLTVSGRSQVRSPQGVFFFAGARWCTLPNTVEI